MSRTELLAAIAIIIALLTAISTIYTVSQQKEATRQLYDEITQLNQTLQSLNSISVQITTLSNEITNIRNQLNNTASSKDLDTLANRISTIEANLILLNQTLQAVNSSNNQQITNLIDQINTLQKQLDTLRIKLEQLEFPVTVTDATGDTIIISARPERIVALAPSIVEILYYVNATDRLVGATDYTDWPPQIAEAMENGTIANVGSFYSPNIEAILSLNPDLVIGLDNVPSHAEIKEILGSRGIPMILLPQNDVYAIKESILIVGKATGNLAEATRAASNYEAEILSLKVASQQVEKAHVAIIVYINPIFIAGEGTFHSSGLNWIGAENAFANYTGWAAVSPEDLLEASPDVIILTGINVTDLVSYLNQTLGNETMSIPAIANNRVYCIGYPLTNLLDRPSPRYAEGLLLLQYIIYPQLYNATESQIPQCITSFPNITFLHG